MGLDDQADFFIGKEMPQDLKDEIANNDESRRQQELAIAVTQKDMEHINERFDRERARFLEIVGPNHGSQVTENH